MRHVVSRLRQWLRDQRLAGRARRAAMRRATLGDVPVVAVTGSAGKTTTVALLAHILGGPSRVATNAFSNRAEDVFRVFDECGSTTSAVVVEASEYPIGTLGRISEAVRPTAAVFTIAGLDHFVAFRAAAAASREMALLAERLPADGFVVCNADDPELRAALAGTSAPVVTFGGDAAADYRLVDRVIGPDHRLTVVCDHGGEVVHLATRFVGLHFHVPVLAAAATAHRLGVSWPEIAARVAGFEPIFGRCNVVTVSDGPTFICDTAKAPAWSCSAAFATLDSFTDAPRRTLVLGTLADYAGDSRRCYRKAVRAALDRVDRLIILRHSASHVGASAADIASGRVLLLDTVAEIAGLVRETAIRGEAILLKGSCRADHLDRIALDFTLPVRCWLDRCGRGIDCVRCDRLMKEPSHRPSIRRRAA